MPASARAVRCVLIISLLLTPLNVGAYSVFTHQQLIDLAWAPFIQPLLLSRFPRTTAAELKDAHAYAYGGCAIQDMGYYPFGKAFFSDLTHYVRTGDFVTSLLRHAQTVQEYAFALGAFSHYVGDNIGHHDAVNRATALAFPKIAARHHADIVTYDQSPHSHVRVEFAFDIGQLSKHHLAPTAYLEFIGLKTSDRLLAQSIHEVYGLPPGSVVGRARPAVRSYRTSVRRFLPRIAHAETVIHRHQFVPDQPGTELGHYLARVNATEFQKLWDKYRRKPAVPTYLLSVLIRILPKVGVLSDLAIKIPTEQTDALYITSVNRSVTLFEQTLGEFKSNPKSIPPIPNRDLDTGERTVPGAYMLTDETYAKFLHRVVDDPERHISPALRSDILNYYADETAPNHTKRSKKKWRQVQDDLRILRTMPSEGGAISGS